MADRLLDRRRSMFLAHRRRLDLLIVLVTAVVVLVAGLVAPKHNWDTVAYVAAATQADGDTGRDLLTRTYADVRAGVDAASYAELTAGPYRGTVASDPVALEQQLPFYTIRVVYVAVVRAVGHAIGSATRAAHRIAAIFGFLSVLAMGAVLIRIGAPAWLLPLIVSPIGIVHLARIGSPDSMACFASLLLVLALDRPGWSEYLLVALLPAIRSDYLILSGLAAAYLFRSDDRARAVFAVVVAGGVYLALGRWSGNYGYLNLINFTLFGQRPYPARLPIETDPRAYAAAIATNLNYLVSDGVFLLFAIASALLWRRRRRLAGDREDVLLLLLPTLFATAHVALFPSYDKRFLVSSFFLVTAGIVRAATARASVARQVAVV